MKLIYLCCPGKPRFQVPASRLLVIPSLAPLTSPSPLLSYHLHFPVSDRPGAATRLGGLHVLSPHLPAGGGRHRWRPHWWGRRQRRGRWRRQRRRRLRRRRWRLGQGGGRGAEPVGASGARAVRAQRGAGPGPGSAAGPGGVRAGERGGTILLLILLSLSLQQKSLQ